MHEVSIKNVENDHSVPCYQDTLEHGRSTNSWRSLWGVERSSTVYICAKR